MVPGCSADEREAICAAGFVNASVLCLDALPVASRLVALEAAIALARLPQLPPLMAALLPQLLADSRTTPAQAAAEAAAVACLCRAVHSSGWALSELLGGERAAAAVAERLVQLLGRASGPTLGLAWAATAELAACAADLDLLLDAGLLQPALFSRAMASGRDDCRIPAAELLQLIAHPDQNLHEQLIEEGMVPVILAACAHEAREVAMSGVECLSLCVERLRRPGSGHLRWAVLQALGSSAFPSANFARLAESVHRTSVFSQLIHALALVLQWPESAVDSARLPPLVQRLVDGGLLPLMEGQRRNEG